MRKDMKNEITHGLILMAMVLIPIFILALI